MATVSARNAPPLGEARYVDLSPPHSNFDLIESLFRDLGVCHRLPSIRRIFSLARILESKSLLIEEVEAHGSVADEVRELKSHLNGYSLEKLFRLSFWSENDDCGSAVVPFGNLLGYALLKVDRWDEGGSLPEMCCHIFEAVFSRYPHHHNCVAFARCFDVRIQNQKFKLKGVLYSQQGPAIKSCAHVAIRSLVMTLTSESDLYYSSINNIISYEYSGSSEARGLTAAQIVQALRDLGLSCTSLDYPKAWDNAQDRIMRCIEKYISREDYGEMCGVIANRLRIQSNKVLGEESKDLLGQTLHLGKDSVARILGGTKLAPGVDYNSLLDEISSISLDLADLETPRWLRKAHIENPYAKFLYAGVEAGGGALLGFELNQPEDEGIGAHIVPFYGHTFNQDTWVPRAEGSYFRMGANTRYVSSHSWLSSFLMHDDNFGPNYSVPKNYLDEDQIRFLVIIQREGVRYDGVTAEGMGIDALSSVNEQGLLREDIGPWMKRLTTSLRRGEVVLRSLALSADEYVDHLNSIRGWSCTEEDMFYIETIQKRLPSMVWMVEISIPELFPANLRKLGEIVLDATNDHFEYDSFLEAGICRLIRLPGMYLLFSDDPDKASFTESPSSILDHVGVFEWGVEIT